MTNDAIYSWIRASLDTIKQEEIYPYVYLQISNGSSCYIPFRTSHPAQYFIGIYTAGEDICKQFNADDLVKNVRHFPDNLNYDNNQRTRLRELYFLLTALFEKVDAKYIF